MTCSLRRGCDRFRFSLVRSTFSIFLLSTCLAVVPGCGSKEPPAQQAVQSTDEGGETAADQVAAAAVNTPVPEKGSPEWVVGEMIVLQSEPLTESKDPKEIAAARQTRHQKMVEMATSVIARTHSNPEKESTFNAAVNFLVDARLQLALAGDTAERDSLFDDAATLFAKIPASTAAAEAAFAVVRYHHSMAQRSQNNPDLLREFSKQARLFATNFPLQHARAAHLLQAAARSCELHGIRDEALACYTMISEKFPETPQAQQASAVLKRINLEGQKLDLGGETPEGGYVKIDDFKGKVVLVVFWSSDSPEFQKQVPQLSQVAKKYDGKGLRVIGVSLDEDETLVDSFIEKNPLPWTQIFSVDRDKRRWDNPVVKAYGVQDIPLYWLVDQNGTVVDSQVNPEELDTRVRSVLAKKTASAE